MRFYPDLCGNVWDPWDVFIITEVFLLQVAKWATSSKMNSATPLD